MKLFAISDLHVGFEQNRRALEGMRPHPEDWLILAGDLGETEEHLSFVFASLAPKFARLLWVPGNHELWTLGREPGALRGVEKYDRLVALARSFGVLTPEDPFPVWEGEGGRCVIAPLFVLYDYSFRPDDVTRDGALAWAMEENVYCKDEVALHPHPYPSRDAWCAARCALSEERLEAVDAELPMVLVNHFPLRQELAHLPAIPRFALWCGTQRTRDWHTRFRARVVVSGHLHIRSTRFIDAVRFEEVSLGYPRQWSATREIDDYLREILPGVSP